VPASPRVLTPPITVTPLTLPNAKGALSYSQQLSASGGDGGPYTFSVRRFLSHVPPGLTLSPTGLLSGIPGQAGRFRFTVQATDSHGKVGSRTYSVVVSPGMSVTATGTGGVSDTFSGPLTSTNMLVQPRWLGPIKSVNGSLQLPGPAHFSISIGSVPTLGQPVYLGTVSLTAPDGTLVVTLTNSPGAIVRTGAAAMAGHFVGSGTVKGKASSVATLDVRIVATN
jgi:hypothetical protein